MSNRHRIVKPYFFSDWALGGARSSRLRLALRVTGACPFWLQEQQEAEDDDDDEGGQQRGRQEAEDDYDY